jgi:precorrin-4/cobalt-precorrin-4 C11-methyltransferase
MTAAPQGHVVFVGAGPGAADLITLRGQRAIDAADIVIWASSLVHPDVVASARGETVDSAVLTTEEVSAYYERAAAEGLTVARVHSGDPAIYGAMHEQLTVCRALGLTTEVIPGVSSFTTLAAAVQRELTVAEVAQSIVLTRLEGGKTPMPPREKVREFARHGTTMALFLSAARGRQLQDELVGGGYDESTPCVVGFQVSWPDELILECSLGDLAETLREHKLNRHTLVLVGPALADSTTRSHLYHPGHFTVHRRADPEARKVLKASR